MSEPPKASFTKQHRLVLLAAGVALMLGGVLGGLNYIDFVAATLVEGPGYDPRLILLALSVLLFVMGVAALISALRMKVE